MCIKDYSVKLRSAFESLNYLLIQSVSFGKISSVGR